jgi:RecB family exonuclease
MERRSIVVHTRLAGHMARVAAARAGACGRQIMTMDQLAARLAGGFIRPIDVDALHEAATGALYETPLGPLERIKSLPGMPRAAVDTLDKVWHAGIDLSSRPEEPRLSALAALERAVLKKLPPAMQPPPALVEAALRRLRHAPTVIGPVEVHGHSEMPPCWRRLLAALAEFVPVVWVAGPRHIPEWLTGSRIEVRRAEAERPNIVLFSCANPIHEATEALRWARALIATGTARPDEIAIAAASPAELDDHVLALRRETNLPVHFVHGVKAISKRDGQATAALAELLVKGLSQERVRRLFRLLHDRSLALSGLPRDWAKVLPSDASLSTLDRWTQALVNGADKWPGGINRSTLVLDALALLVRGPEAAAEAGERLLAGLALKLWRRALSEGPAGALPVTLAELRIEDRSQPEPAASILWCSAAALASAPRPFARLIGVNSGRWPRQVAEDRLIPDHLIPLQELDPLPVAAADRRDFATIMAAAARTVSLSYSRRDAEGRLLGRSPLIAGMEEIYLARGRIPEHAASEADRLLARPGEFADTPIGRSGIDCWRDWYASSVTPHDGLVQTGHPRIVKALARKQSASSLRVLLRDPIRFVWRYALGWRQPDQAEEPVILDSLSFGNLVHGVLREAVEALERDGGFAIALAPRIEATIDAAVSSVARRWEAEAPVPPPITWKNAKRRARELAMRALSYPLDPLPGQQSWAEAPFGLSAGQAAGYERLPWDATEPVEIPGTEIAITGYIDRLDMAGDGSAARVIDYKTGKVATDQADICLRGGDELQRCLYAFAANTLLHRPPTVEAALLFPRPGGGLFLLPELDRQLDKLAGAITIARAGLLAGNTLPGIAATIYNDLEFALPANAAFGYLARKMPRFAERLGDATAIWNEP